MEYEICCRCRFNAHCIIRTQDCKRWNAIYQGMKDDLDALIDEHHKTYDNLQYLKG